MSGARLYLVALIMALLPATRCFPLKRLLLRWAGAKIGDGVRVASSARIWLAGPLSIGKNCWIGHQVMITGGDASVILGSNVDIGPRVILIGGSHMLGADDSPHAAGSGYSLPIIVEDGVWIGAGATVLGGITIGAKAVIGAGALVNADVAAGTRVGGVPAKVLKGPHLQSMRVNGLPDLDKKNSNAQDF